MRIPTEIQIGDQPRIDELLVPQVLFLSGIGFCLLQKHAFFLFQLLRQVTIPFESNYVHLVFVGVGGWHAQVEIGVFTGLLMPYAKSHVTLELKLYGKNAGF